MHMRTDKMQILSVQYELHVTRERESTSLFLQLSLSLAFCIVSIVVYLACKYPYLSPFLSLSQYVFHFQASVLPSVYRNVGPTSLQCRYTCIFDVGMI